MGSDSEASITIKNINEQKSFLPNLHSNIMLETAVISTKVAIKLIHGYSKNNVTAAIIIEVSSVAGNIALFRTLKLSFIILYK